MHAEDLMALGVNGYYGVGPVGILDNGNCSEPIENEEYYGIFYNLCNAKMVELFEDDEFELSDYIHDAYYECYEEVNKDTYVYVFDSFQDLSYALSELRSKLKL